jgi:glutaredoxin
MKPAALILLICISLILSAQSPSPPIDEKQAPKDFMMLVHSFGYYCHMDKKEEIYKYIRESKSVIHNPYFFIGDQCLALKPYVFEYFSLLKAYDHAVDEKTFNRMIF